MVAGLVGLRSKHQTRINRPPRAGQHVTPTRNKEHAMDQDLMIEWGPTHLREEAASFDVELTDRPDDN